MRYGLIAGSGRFPLLALESARRLGHDVTVVAIEEEASREVEALQTAFRLLTRSNLNTSQAIERIQAEVPPCAAVEELIEFIRASARGVIK